MKKELKLLLLSNYVNIFGYSLFAPLYALFVFEVGGSAFHAGATWGLYMLAAGLIMFLFSFIEDHVHRLRKKMIVGGYFVLSLGALSFILVQNPMHIYWVQLINALGVGMLDPAWKAVYAKDEDIGKESEEWALFDGGDKILIAVAAFLGGVFITSYSFKQLFLVMFAIQFVAAVISIKLLQRK